MLTTFIHYEEMIERRNEQVLIRFEGLERL